VKQFFFEKKNQKTFGPLREVVKPPGALRVPMTKRPLPRSLNRAAPLHKNKVFLLLFVHKKKCLLSSFPSYLPMKGT
jgi:hypothetical protein